MTVIKIEDIGFVQFSAPDLSKMKAFLEDFGLKCDLQKDRLYARGTDGTPFAHVTYNGPSGFIGLGFRVRSLAELELIAEHEEAQIREFEAPGGGHIVSLRDPDGNAVDVVAGQAPFNPEPLADQAPVNTLRERPRVSRPVRFDPAPSHVRRLGHALILVSDFSKSYDWYNSRLGLIASDQVQADGRIVGAFLRADRGDTPTDHHTLAIIDSAEGPAFGHAAFEVDGFDDLMKGHTFLEDRGREHAWGVGRHILGSQIFDYWKDPWGHELEHWTDGDLLRAEDPPCVRSVEEALGTLWGPRHPMLSA